MNLTIENDEIIHHGPLALKQQWTQYTKEQHETWSFLFEKQFKNLQGIAYSPWLEAIHQIGLEVDHIPKLTTIAEKLSTLTQWIPVPISGFLTPQDYFAYLAQRQFPTVVHLRSRSSWAFIVEPDLFHDAFGHLPMHIHPIFADFLHLFGRVARDAKTPEEITALTRLYWFTVEYGLIRENGVIKVCGSGHMSGFKEAQYSLSSEVEKRPFDFKTVIAQDYNPHILQKVLFVMESYEQLYEALRENF